MRGRKTSMRKTTKLIAVFIAMSICTLSSAMAQEEATITVSPNNLAISSTGTKVTIHTNIPAGSVNVSTLELSVDGNGSLAPIATFADDRGNLVAKFDMWEVKSYVSVPRAEFTMTGVYFVGGSFSASDVIKVTK
jgi:hypothetical protein